MKITTEVLKKELNYNPQTGKFTWIKIKQGVVVGAQAGSISYYGYTTICVNGKNYQASRLAWLYVYGKWPEGQIDHINHNKTDNRIINLRDTTYSENQQNQVKAHLGGKYKLPLGVTFDKQSGKYKVRLNLKGKVLLNALFETSELASTAYLKAKRKHHTTCTI